MFFCAKGLSALLSHHVNQGHLRGLQVCAPTISHLLFANDSMLYTQATPQDCLVINHCLHVYELASGHKVNLQKGSVVFSSNVPLPLQDSLTQLLGVEKVLVHDKYLGLPTYVGRSEAFGYIKDRLTKKLKGWRSNLLSSAGREMLIKMVA